MKRLSKNLVKSLTVITLFTAAAVTLSTSGVPAISEAHATANASQVNSYLTGCGYTVYSETPITWYRTDDWQANTTKNGVNYITTVHVSGSNIIGHEDVVM